MNTFKLYRVYYNLCHCTDEDCAILMAHDEESARANSINYSVATFTFLKSMLSAIMRTTLTPWQSIQEQYIILIKEDYYGYLSL